MSNSLCDSCGSSCDGRCANQKRGIKFSFFNNRCVKAKLVDTSYDGFKAIDSIVDKATRKELPPEVVSGITYGLTKGICLKDSYEGKSQLNILEGDTYNKETGVKLAKIRCLSAYHKDFDKVICVALERARTLVVALQTYCARHEIDTSKTMSEKDIYEKIYLSGYKANEK